MNNVKMGFCRSDITPPLGVIIPGYFYERRAEGVIDPLYINALAVQDGEKSAVVLVCDLIGAYRDAGTALAQEVAKAAGIDYEAVFICHTHTHTGPTVMHHREENDPMYQAWFLRRLCDAAVMALRDCKPITYVKGFEGQTKGLTFYRRYKMKNGAYQTWAERGDPNILEPAGKADESLRFVRVGREGGDEIVLVNFQCHPDNVSNCMISADFPGYLRAKVETEKPGTRCVFLNGCQGNLDYVDWQYLSTCQKKVDAAIELGTGLADFVLAHYEEADHVAGEGVSYGKLVRNCTTKRASTNMEEVMRIIEIHEAGKDEELLGPDWIATPMVADAFTRRRLEEGKQDFVPMILSAVTVGGLALVGFPGEPFCEIGVQTREASPYPMTMACCLTNGCEGYYPTIEAFEQGGYEPGGTRFPKGIAEILRDAAVELLQQIHG